MSQDQNKRRGQCYSLISFFFSFSFFSLHLSFCLVCRAGATESIVEWISLFEDFDLNGARLNILRGRGSILERKP